MVHEEWHWDVNNKSKKVEIDSSFKIANFFPLTISDGTAGTFISSSLFLFILNFKFKLFVAHMDSKVEFTILVLK